MCEDCGKRIRWGQWQWTRKPTGAIDWGRGGVCGCIDRWWYRMIVKLTVPSERMVGV